LVWVLDEPEVMPHQPPWDIRERSFEFACEIVHFSLKLSEKRGCRPIADQLLRAGTGVGANTEEAKAAYSRREFGAKNSVALKESREARFWLRLIDRCELADDAAKTRLLLNEAGELVGILTATVRTVREEEERRKRSRNSKRRQ
jgi:four helix bundle protein